MTLLAPGLCRHCACTDEHPCGYCKGIHGCAAWTTSDRLVCSNPPCIRAEADRVRAARAAKQSPYKGWGFGAICLEKRRQKRRKGRTS